jgi:hypothetical protein
VSLSPLSLVWPYSRLLWRLSLSGEMFTCHERYKIALFCGLSPPLDKSRTMVTVRDTTLAEDMQPLVIKTLGLKMDKEVTQIAKVCLPCECTWTTASSLPAGTPGQRFATSYEQATGNARNGWQQLDLRSSQTNLS